MTKKRILLVEDTLLNQIVGQKMLESNGFEVIIAPDGREALNTLLNERFDCVLMDIQMPVMNGIETARAIRRGEAGVAAKDVPIIAMTAYTSHEDEEAVTAVGMNGYLTKPLDVARVMSIIDEVVE